MTLSFDGHHVEPARAALVSGVALEKCPGGPCQLLPLCGGDARRAVAEASVVAQTDFDENQLVAVHHDDVQLAQTAAEIAGYQLEAPRAEMVQRGRFCPGTCPCLGRQRADCPAITGSGSRRPLRISPHASSRRNRPEPSTVSRPVLPSSWWTPPEASSVRRPLTR